MCDLKLNFIFLITPGYWECRVRRCLLGKFMNDLLLLLSHKDPSPPSFPPSLPPFFFPARRGTSKSHDYKTLRSVHMHVRLLNIIHAQLCENILTLLRRIKISASSLPFSFPFHCLFCPPPNSHSFLLSRALPNAILYTFLIFLFFFQLDLFFFPRSLFLSQLEKNRFNDVSVPSPPRPRADGRKGP